MRRRRILLAELVVVVILLCSVGFVAVSGATQSTTVSGASTAADEHVDGTDDTPPHVDPDEYDEDGDLSEVQSWLAQQLADRLYTSTTALERDKYDSARAQFDDTYRDHYDEYAPIVRDSGDYEHENLDGTLPEAFVHARAETISLADALEAYDERSTEYDRAVARDDEDAAVELALELDRRAAEIEAANESLHQQFAIIEAVSRADLQNSPETVRAIDTEIQAQQAEIRAARFTDTSLTADADGDTVTPAETVTLTGSIDADDEGWPAGQETVTIAVNGEAHDLEVTEDPQGTTAGIDEDGTFVLEYRPEPLGSTADELHVEYVPATGIGHRSTETTIPVAVESVEPTVTLDGPERVGYGDTVLVTGEFTADDLPVENALLTVSLGETALETVETVEGSFSETVSIPATVPDGERELAVSFDATDRALEPVSTREPVTVTERESRLTLYVTETATGQLYVEGALTAVGGDAISGQPIRLDADGDHVADVRTADDGSFDETITVEPPGDNATITATYDGDGTNVGSGAERTTAETTTQASWIDDWGLIVYVLAGSLLVGGALVGVWRLVRYYRSPPVDDGGFASVFGDRSRASSTRPSADSPDGTVTASATPGPDRRPTNAELPVSIGPSHSHELLKQASTQLSSGRTNEAIQSAYVAARMELQSFVPEGQTLTHWEFHEQYSGPHADALGEITEQYERAAFGLEHVSREDASEAVVSARLLVDGMSDDDGSHDLDGIVLEE
ncbi:hypothetical protein D8Y22_07455 [Salinadaptatus halalkaliphilus]|uniref:DUF4129 domain-containing protein n=1 Tax=Salinadaptatus halalkaliphilus TaxID=2419781 RepID=A0A4S3TPF8_9EURY|nr:hypothetical protein [Salinadaptatus halalkaliphilus]THE65055.1 hypothetical protein D8Y22_07455 [Salinadaptatus halalkaliphilus]